ncbi:hypothetical protein AS026_28615 [Rhizobium altiplani]|uniref:ATPase AAA-type core domain-containing protein n=1 Tax=Rhizobium altiplani TaxID=1864509 RepID=A0A109K202_9HYPH|nr:AAA family ATPase [Rhizobium altiplani]KWV59351.1 hypothetical protein AS026_28615 [Rhizobium altiplani]
MQVIYAGRAGGRSAPTTPLGEGDVLELLDNNWNDFGYETTFNTACRINGEIFHLGLLKILFTGTHVSRALLKDRLENGWDGSFPIADISYTSVPIEVSFYAQLVSNLGEETATSVAVALRDASYLVNVKHDPGALHLSITPGFGTSLQRERGEQQSFANGWKIFANEVIAVNNLEFRFVDAAENLQDIRFNFQPTTLLPSDINILIGPNGVGKSRLLHQIVEDWIEDRDKIEDGPGFLSRPNLSQIVLLSYSPFENFPVRVEGSNRQDTDVYRYFGLRDSNEPSSSTLSLDTPKRATAFSLLACAIDDIRFRSMQTWAKKVATAEKVLRTAFDFDFAALEVQSDTDAIYSDNTDGAVFDDAEGKRFVRLSPSDLRYLHTQSLIENLIAQSGVAFFKNGTALMLSSGQRLFSYIVINLLGVMRRNSLILIDEPELFLHPNLEIQLIEMLKEILREFSSKALFATHSIVTVREVPADCVHVFARTDEGIAIKTPPFQTFGGDIQRITSYVFGDRAVSKPFEAWIDEQLQEHSAADLINMLRDQLNEEMIIQIAAKGRQ